MFKKILIANRGEIACRIIATARRMGIATVAVYSEADRAALHVSLADEAYAIGPAPARQSYLRGDVILDVARRAGAEAVHPGYGFLSENADFAEACAAAKIVFIGPRPASIRAMGSKAAAKTLMEKFGVPLVPGYHGSDQSAETLRLEAEKIGFPVLLKASAGGGGKGMRVVESAADFGESLDRARGEARASFGNDAMLVEKYLASPRHIEVQVFGDTHGDIVSLFERDCSIQRRHQKILEEAPAPAITPAQRTELGKAAVAAARAVDYVGAGTVEFIYEENRFYFMEMNTRLQVEHPVTEFITGLDLVEWQFRVAAGERLPCLQDQIVFKGHAIEARICAEDPARDFQPATGRITHLRLPPADDHVRVDIGVREGDTITPNYDSMLAKLIVWGEDRTAALRKFLAALEAVEICGPATNLDLLRRIAAAENFCAGVFDTGFLARNPALLAAPSPSPAIWAAATLAALRPSHANTQGDPGSPWGELDGWRMNGDAETVIHLTYGETIAIHARRMDTGLWHLDLPTGPFAAHLREPDQAGVCVLETEENQITLRILSGRRAITVIERGQNHVFAVPDMVAPPKSAAAAAAKLTAPTPARVAQVFVSPGMAVTKGQKLLILEAMKVETVFLAPHDGVVKTVHVTADEMIEEGTQLISFDSEGGGVDGLTPRGSQ